MHRAGREPEQVPLLEFTEGLSNYIIFQQCIILINVRIKNIGLTLSYVVKSACFDEVPNDWLRIFSVTVPSNVFQQY